MNKPGMIGRKESPALTKVPVPMVERGNPILVMMRVVTRMPGKWANLVALRLGRRPGRPGSKVGLARAWVACLVLGQVIAGCKSHDLSACKPPNDGSHYRQVATRIEYPILDDRDTSGLAPSLAPRTLRTENSIEYWDLTLEEAMQIALGTATVMRDLGARVVQTPANAQTIYGPAIQDTDPRFGVDAALSAFDAEFATSTFWEKNDRALNNSFFGGGTRLLQQDLGVFQAQLSKRGATGTLFSVRNNTDYDSNNAPGNFFPSAWNTNIEVEGRQPLLQGGGIAFNRIAGPQAIPGFYNGVLIARINTDVRLAELEEGLRNLVSDLENAYWDLYFAYRDLDAKIMARDSALDTWRGVQALYQAGREGGEAEKEAQAREQYYFFQSEVENALSGRPVDGTTIGNGSSGGTFRGTEGVFLREARLRRVMGLSANDGRLIRPVDEPVRAPVAFNWDECLQEAISRRPELRKQQWQIKRRQLELQAARNFLLPRLDGVGRYRWRGFGDRLVDLPNGAARFDNAVGNLADGQFQEWQLGFQLTTPIGFRRGHAAVRNAELQLARERAVLHEQELQISHDLNASIVELDRALVLAQTNYNRREAAEQQLAAVQAAFKVDKAPLNLLLEAQRRLANVNSLYHRSLIEYSLAIKNVHFERGSLLEYNQVHLAEGPWPSKAYLDARKRQRDRNIAMPMNFALARPHPLARPGQPTTHLEGVVGTEAITDRNVEGLDRDLPPQESQPASPQARRAEPAASVARNLEHPEPSEDEISPQRPRPGQIQIPSCWLRFHP